MLSCQCLHNSKALLGFVLLSLAPIEGEIKQCVQRCFEGVCTWSPSAQNTAKIPCRHWAEGWESKRSVVGLFPCLSSHCENLRVCQTCWLNKKKKPGTRTGLYWTCFRLCFCVTSRGNAVRFWDFVTCHFSLLWFYVKIYCVLTICCVSHCFMVELNYSGFWITWYVVSIVLNRWDVINISSFDLVVYGINLNRLTIAINCTV